jgi:hypothetical protein
LPPRADPTVSLAGCLSEQELKAAHCWEADDQVPRRSEMTEFRRRLRYHQSRWREAHGHAIGSQPHSPRPDGGPARLVGSRLPLAYARESGTNFLTPAALDAARARTSIIEPTRASILLRDQSTFSAMTVEELLDADVLPPQTAAALRDRYLLERAR